MVHMPFDPACLPSLEDKVVVLTGGATGIGRAAVIQFIEAGAKVVFGDINSTAASSLLAHQNSSSSSHLAFQHCDTSNYASQLSLFRLAFSLHSRIDIVVANAGISITKDPFAPCSDVDITVEPSTAEIDVNLKGALFSTRIGLHYLRKNEGEGGDVVLVSSIAGFKESQELVTYAASKHGVVGIGRGLASKVVQEGLRVNIVCPWMTKTQMVRGIEDGWRSLGLPENTAEDVARSILLCATANRRHDGAVQSKSKPLFAGKILWIAGGEAYEIEDKIQELEPVWLGEENSRLLKIGQDYLHGGASWDTAR